MGSPKAFVRPATSAPWTGVLGLALVSGGAFAIQVAPAQAQTVSAATPDDRRQAAKDFAEGDRAFAGGDYRQAAESYERAYRRVPHYDVLWNAARAWHRAGELTRAANAYAHYLRDAPPGARDRNSAQRALNELSTKLAQLEIHAPGLTALTIDDEPLEGASVYVTPGAHVIAGRTADGAPVRKAQDVHGGDDVSVTLVAPPPVPPVPTDSHGPPPPPGDEGSSLRTWSPLVVIIGGAATVALAGVTVWSGLDTVAEKNTFEQNPTRQDVLNAGDQKEARTNILLGVTAGAAVLTGVAAIFFVDWHGKSAAPTKDSTPTARVGVGPGTLSVQGVF